MPEKPLVSVIIVSYNTREMTLDCLRTLSAGLGAIPADIWLVDNASRDGSLEAVAAAYPQVHCIANPRNAGFGAANNLAMAQAQGEYFLLLNSDAFVKPGAVQAMVDYLAAHGEAGAVGPRLLNADGSLQLSCYRFPSPFRAWVENLWISALLPKHPVIGDYRHWPHDTQQYVDWIIGACILVRREVYQQVGGFDERFFMYQEETDWQRNMRDKGWKIGFTPSAVVTHLGGASGTVEKAKVSNHFFESLDYYEFKHHGMVGLISLRVAMMIGCALRTLIWLLMVIVPGRQKSALSKLRLHSWLFVRQATHWRFSFKQENVMKGLT